MKKLNRILALLLLINIQAINGNATLNAVQKNIYKSVQKNMKVSIEGTFHNMSKLSDYDLFHNPSSKLIQSAFIINPNRFEISLNNSDKISKRSVEIYCYDYSKTDAFGKFVVYKFKQVPFTQFSNKLIFEPAGLDMTKNYLIDINGERSDIFLDPSVGGILDTYFNAENVADLGVKFTGNTVVFKVWSPPAGKILLKLFDKDQKPVITVSDLELKCGEKGLWAIELATTDIVSTKSFDGLFYQYEVYAYGNKTIALDPYAKSMAAFDPNGADKIGKGAIVSMTNASAVPLIFDHKYKNSQYMANAVDLVAYEAHVHDFTIQPGMLKPEIAGTFVGFQKKIGYLKNLGITHVQLMPIQNFYTVNENDHSYKGTDAPTSNYNWGYDPHNYFTPEGWFSTDAANPYTRIRELRELIQALHDQGIGVIMDVVYNHTYTTEIFENIAPGCYFRYDKGLKISGATGAGPSVECRRKMVRKLIIESLKYFVENYHVDGFRFDLMGFFDHEIIDSIRSEVGAAYHPENHNELILQGEAWVFSDIDTDVKAKGINAATTKLNYPEKKLNLGLFNDCSRDSYTGRESNPGFVQGVFTDADKVAAGIVGGLKGFDPGNKVINTARFHDAYNLFANDPENCLNYLSIHDGYTLWDKINLSVKDETKLVRAKLIRLANAMLFTSQGKIIMNGGDELLRTKPLAQVDKEQHRAHTSDLVTEEEGTKFFHENTYCSNDFTNMIRWDRLTGSYSSICAPMIEYYKGLIEMRRNIPAFRYKNAENVKKGLVFLCDSDNIAAMKPAIFSGFDDQKLQKLTIKFCNGPKNEKYYLAGEIHPKGVYANPIENNFVVDFNADGIGLIEFSKGQIDAFELAKWGQGEGLNLKLIKSPGSWETIRSAYSEMGNNLITVNGINENFETVIDLQIKDFAAGVNAVKNDSFIAYMLDNTLEKDIAPGLKGTKFTKIVIIHNSGEKPATISIAALNNPAAWHVIMDGNNAGIKPLLYTKQTKFEKGKTNVLIEKRKVVIPAMSSAVIVKN